MLLIYFRISFSTKNFCCFSSFVFCEKTEHSGILLFHVHEYIFQSWLIFLLYEQINLKHIWSPNVINYDITRIFLISAVIADRKRGSLMTIEYTSNIAKTKIDYRKYVSQQLSLLLVDDSGYATVYSHNHNNQSI